MRILSYLALVLLAACQPAAEQPTGRPVAAAPAAPAAPPTAAASAAAPYLGYHRYRGTVGGRPVTVELTIGPGSYSHDSTVCKGSYRYDRHPGGLLLLRGPRPWRPGQPLRLVEADTARPRAATGTWQATGPAGPVLAGTWRSPAGQALPFGLREDYTDGRGHLMAVRYEIFGESLNGAPCRPERETDETKAEYRERLRRLDTASISRQYLRLLEPSAGRPDLRFLQCPPARARRAAMRKALAEADDCVALTDGLGVSYNDYGLLAIWEYHEEFYFGTPHPMHAIDAAIYDLRTGQTLQLPDLLLPGTDHVLRQLITARLRQELELEATEVLHPAEGDTLTTELPRTGVGLAADGLQFQYADYELGGYAYGMPQVTLPWAELQPLLRTDSPVAQMLRERGLWRGK